MTQLQKGDKLKYLGQGWAGIAQGDVVTFDSYVDAHRKYVRVQETVGRFSNANQYAWCFELIERLPAPSMILSEDPTVRKSTPITTGVLDYFPRALAAVAQCSKAGNDQHNPGQPLHWAKGKSTDHADCIARHLIDRESIDTDGIAHAAKLAWRALAYLETKLEQEASK